MTSIQAEYILSIIYIVKLNCPYQLLPKHKNPIELTRSSGGSLEDSYYLLKFRKEAQRKFKRDGLSLINAIQEQSNHNEPYEMDVEYFAHHYRSSIYRFNDLLQLQFQQLNQQYSSIKKHALMRFLFVILTLILVYLLAIYIVFYVSFKIVTPLANMVGKIKSFNNDTSCFSDENNEINELQNVKPQKI